MPTIEGDGHSAEESLGAMKIEAVALEEQVQPSPGEVIGGVEEVECQIAATETALDGRKLPRLLVVRLDAQLAIHPPCNQSLESLVTPNAQISPMFMSVTVVQIEMCPSEVFW